MESRDGAGPHEAAAPRSRRFLLTPRWIGFHLLCLAGIVLMVNLSLWQWHRLGERKDFNERVTSRSELAVENVQTLVPPDADAALADEVDWRAGQANGAYVADETFLVANRSQGGQAGSNVVTPLVLDDGRTILVNRGFLPLGDDVPDAPDGDVRVAGIVRISQAKRVGQLTSSERDDTGMLLVQRIDIGETADRLGTDLLPVYLEMQVSDPADGAGLAPVAAPELDEGSHLSYAIQWLIFSTCVAVGWVFAVRRSLRTRAATDRSVGL